MAEGQIFSITYVKALIARFRHSTAPEFEKWEAGGPRQGQRGSCALDDSVKAQCSLEARQLSLVLICWLIP